VPVPIPAHVVTGPLGSGKTTAIARLLAAKPAHEDWVVLLNEFSDAGIDALTVASAARGAFDVRLVPGGCLCCTGEQDFRRNLQELVTERRPHRILVEPTGLGHPAGIVEELLAWESSGALRLAGVVALVDPQRLRDGSLRAGGDAHAQCEIADALLLSKPDLADADDHARFAAFAAALFPAKSWVGPMVDGRIPPQALEPRRLAPRDPPPIGRPPVHAAERHEHGRTAAAAGDAGSALADEAGAEVAVANGLRRDARHIGHAAWRWVFPRSVAFSRPRLESLLASAGAEDRPLGAVVRVKGVFRTGEDDWVLAQWDGRGVDVRPSSWRRDSRVEVLLEDLPAAPATTWDAAWLRTQQR
jgi:G3E family GTPase